MTKLEKLSVTLAEENALRTSSPLRSLSSPSPCHLVEALVESPLYEKVNCRVRLLVDSGPSSWDGQVKRLAVDLPVYSGVTNFLQGLTASLTLRRGTEVALVPSTQVSYQVNLMLQTPPYLVLILSLSFKGIID